MVPKTETSRGPSQFYRSYRGNGDDVATTNSRRRMYSADVTKGTKQSLTHSKFSVNISQGGVRKAELNQTPGNQNTSKMSDVKKEISNQIIPETSTPTELKSVSCDSIWSNQSLKNLNRATTPGTATGATAEDEPRLKHHLEQVFIKPPLPKKD